MTEECHVLSGVCTQVKVSMLCYMHGLVDMMQPQDFSNSSDIRLAVSRIVTWTTEPKSIEVRKVCFVLAQNNIYAVFIFSSMMLIRLCTFQHVIKRKEIFAQLCCCFVAITNCKLKKLGSLQTFCTEQNITPCD